MRSCHVLRVFTRGDVGGNHLGVVNDASGLDTDAMQGVAADLGFSETVFLHDRGSDGPFVRIFTPAAEMQFAGHPLVGAAWMTSVRSRSFTESTPARSSRQETEPHRHRRYCGL